MRRSTTAGLRQATTRSDGGHAADAAPARAVPPAGSFAQLARRLQIGAPPCAEGGAPAGHAEFPRAPVQRLVAPSQQARAAPDYGNPAVSGRSGLPSGLRAHVEGASGFAMDDVRVHRNSPAPAALGALAYAQGRDIHLAPGQERHLPHEAWHVVQQKQGRVRPTLGWKGIGINDDPVLEREADAFRAEPPARSPRTEERQAPSGIVQRKISYNRGRFDNRKQLRDALLAVVRGPEAADLVEQWIRAYEKIPESMFGSQVFDYILTQIEDEDHHVVRGTSVSGSVSRHGPLLPIRANADAGVDPDAAMSSFRFSNVTLGRLTIWPLGRKQAKGKDFHARQDSKAPKNSSDFHAEDGLIRQFEAYAAEKRRKDWSEYKANLTINNFFCSQESTNKSDTAKHCLGRILELQRKYRFGYFHVYFRNTYGDVSAMPALVARLRKAGILVTVFALKDETAKYVDKQLDPESDSSDDEAASEKKAGSRKRKAKIQTPRDASSEDSSETESKTPRRTSTKKRPEKRPRTKRGKDETSGSRTSASSRSHDRSADGMVMEEDAARTETERNGNCLYAAVNIYLGNADDMDDALRQMVTDFALNNPGLAAAAGLDLDDVIRTLSTPNLWAGDSGDLAPAFLASAIGRNIVVIADAYVTYIEAAHQAHPDDIVLFLHEDHYTVAPPGTKIPSQRKVRKHFVALKTSGSRRTTRNASLGKRDSDS